MAATFVKVTELKNAGGTSASGSVSATAGNALIVCVGIYYETSLAQNPTLVVSGGGTWTTDGRYDHHFTSNDNLCLAFASCPSATGGTQTVTLTWTVSGSPPVTVVTAFVYEFSGMPTSAILDAIGTGANGTTSPITSASQTNTNATDVMLACGFTLSGANETHGSPTNSWIMPTGGDETNASGQTGVSAYKIVSATAAQSTSWTDSPVASWSSFIAAYKQAAGPTTFPLTRSLTQTQSLALASPRTLRRTLTALTQAQSLGITALATVTVPITRTVTQAQSVALGFTRALRRTLSATQSQTASVATVVQAAAHYFLSGLATQAQNLSIATAQARLPINYYTTTFPLTENPINESGVWTLGGRDALDWTNPRTTPGKAFGTQSGTDNPPYTDSIAVMKGTWGSDQEATATVFNSLGNVGPYCECELLLRFTVTPHAVTGYEFTLNANSNLSYFEVNRWNGLAFGNPSNYTQIGSYTTNAVVHNGDVVKATMVGSTIRLFVNGTQVLTVTDTTYTGGAPGIGFFTWDNGTPHVDPTLYGFTRFMAHTVGTPFPAGGQITQPQSLRLVRQSRLSRTLGVAQVLSLPRAVTLTRALSVVTSVVGAAGLVVSRTLSIAQAQVATLLTPQKVILRAVSATQSQTARLLKTVQLPRSVNVNQVLAFVRRLSLTRTLTQAESATVISRPTLGHIYALTGTCGVGQSATLTTHVTLILQVLWAATTDHFATSGTNPTTYWDPAARIFQTTGGKPPAKWTGVGGQFHTG